MSIPTSAKFLKMISLTSLLLPFTVKLSSILIYIYTHNSFKVTIVKVVIVHIVTTLNFYIFLKNETNLYHSISRDTKHRL